MIPAMDEREFGVLHLFAGIGGGALGFQQASEEWNGLRGRYRTLGGIDVDEEACRDFEALTGVPATRLDLFSRDDYTAFHGREPGPDWHEATPDDIRRASGGIRPDVVFLSPPCKGISALLPKKQAESPKYQALNRLTVRGISLALEAWAHDPIGLLILENVPRITSSRGDHLLGQIKRLLRRHGYMVQDGTHDMGVVGGLSQHRRRYLLVARHPAKVPPFVFQAPERRVRSIGEAIGPLPMPDDPAGGPMHRLPRLNWLTWLRLALIPAGGDWRNLCDVGPGSYRIEPEADQFAHTMRVAGWDDVAGTVTGAGRPANGAITVADPRLDGPPHFNHAYHVTAWGEPSGAVASGGGPTNGVINVADPRLGHEPRKGVFRIARWDEPAGTVVGSARSAGSNGMASVADPRLPGDRGEGFKGSPGLFGVQDWDAPSQAVTGSASVSGSNMPAAVADPRGGPYGVMDWNEPSGTVTGNMRPSCGTTPASVADPRIPSRDDRRSGQLSVRGWEDAANTVTGEDSVGSGAQSLADPRLPGQHWPGHMTVTPWDESARTVTGQSGAFSSNAGASVADPRLTCTPHNGAFRVVPWDEPAPTVTGAGDVHAQGAAAVADPRVPCDGESGVWVIVAEDGTWHRPLTTLELAVLQGFPAVMPDGRPLTLAGKSQSRHRERVGNAVPPPAARGIAGMMLLALLPASEGVQWVMSPYGTDVWVRPGSGAVVQ